MSSLTTEQERDVGSLGFSMVEADNPMLAVRAAQWRNSLAKVGLAVPFWVVHDIGLLLVHAPSEIRIRRALEKVTLAPEAKAALEKWREILKEIAQTEMVERSRSWKLSDALVVVVLLRVLGPVFERHLGPGRRPTAVPLPIDPDVYTGLDNRLLALFTGAGDRRGDWSFLYHLVNEHLRLLTSIEQVDPHPLPPRGRVARTPPVDHSRVPRVHDRPGHAESDRGAAGVTAQHEMEDADHQHHRLDAIVSRAGVTCGCAPWTASAWASTPRPCVGG